MARAASLLLLCTALPSNADGQDLSQREALTGDWSGKRSALSTQGVAFDIDYTGEVASNVRGGVSRGSVYEGRLGVAVDADLGMLFEWNAMSFHAQVFQIHGRGLSTDHVGNIMTVSNIEAVPSTRLFTLWLQQDLLDGRASVRAGQLAADDEFVVTPSASELMNGTFGWFTLASAGLPSDGPAYPLAAPGIRLRLEPSRSFALLAAAFSGDPAGNPGAEDPQRVNRHGTTFSFDGGTLWIAEAQYRVGLDEHGSVLPGEYRLGGWYHTGQFADQRLDSNGDSLASPGTSGAPLLHRGNYAVYASADQTLWRRPGTDDEGVSLFVRAGAVPANRNLVDFYADGGLRWKGLLPDRGEDVMSIGLAYARISSDARELDQDTRTLTGMKSPVRDHEALVEWTYSLRMTRGWTLQPDIQYVVHPGGNVSDPDDPSGTKPIPNAWVIGLRSIVTF